LAKLPSALPSQKVPAILQQYLPAFLPLLVPVKDDSLAAGHIPNCDDLNPLGSRPHLLTSQQFAPLMAISLWLTDCPDISLLAPAPGAGSPGRWNKYMGEPENDQANSGSRVGSKASKTINATAYNAKAT
jgi:hypothetical protein